MKVWGVRGKETYAEMLRPIHSVVGLWSQVSPFFNLLGNRNVLILADWAEGNYMSLCLTWRVGTHVVKVCPTTDGEVRVINRDLPRTLSNIARMRINSVVWQKAIAGKVFQASDLGSEIRPQMEISTTIWDVKCVVGQSKQSITMIWWTFINDYEPSTMLITLKTLFHFILTILSGNR